MKRLGDLCLAVLLLGPSAYAFIQGGGRLALWWTAHQPSQYAVAYPYLGDAVPWMASGLLGLIGSLAVLTSGQRSLRWLWFPAVTLLYCLLSPLQHNYGWFFHHAIHPMNHQPIEWAQDLTRHDFLRITGVLTFKAKATGGFSCPGDGLKAPSRFMSGGQILMYEVRCMDRPFQHQPSPPTRPGIILMRISEDRQEAWFQVTTLVQDTGEAVTWVSNVEGQDFVIHESIKEVSKSVKKLRASPL
jgi:hypothetical protein